MPTVITTQRATGNILQTRRTVDIARDIENVNVSDIPFVILSTRLRRRPVADSLVRWVEDEYLPQVDAINNGAGYAAGDTVLTVDNGNYFKPGDLVYVTRTGETVRVTATTSTTITVTRSWGAVAAAALVDNDELLIVGPAIAEGNSAPEPRTTLEVERQNYIQTFRTTYTLTDELGNDITLLTEGDKDYQRRKKLQEHLFGIERALFFGEKNEDLSSTSSPIRSMGGLREWITTNVTDAGGTLSQTEWNTFLESGLRRGSSEKWFFAAPRIMTAISGFSEAVLRTRPEDETFGVKVVDYISPHGMVHLVMHRLFSESALSAGTNTESVDRKGFLVDMERIWLRVMADTFRRENIQNPDQLLVKEEYVTKLSVEVRNEKAHALLKNVTG
jgi:hypothetical protein